ncbi:MAG TPA: alpha/beta fold hydrolase [Chitinophagaceae bacterium]|jgi:pimeloyl-ACP methyl ester carboxylesterase|nr:alpha/beta fold hydrolase [Chitinophagaceae bacterium]
MKLTQRLALSYVRTKFGLLSLVSKRKAAQKALELFCTPQSRKNKPPSVIFDEAEKLKFELEGIWVHGYRWSHPKNKKVLIIHGFESSITNFDHFVQPLINKGYEVLAFDAPGHGSSGGNMITAPLFAKMIITIHENYGPIQSFITHSFGGLAISLGLENIVHDESYKVALIAPATESKTAIDQFFHLLHLNGEVRKEFDGLIAELGKHSAEWFSIRRAIRNIKAQILWLHDEGDEQTPLSDALKVKNENLANVKFIVTKGLGHRRIYRDAKTVQDVVDFL